MAFLAFGSYHNTHLPVWSYTHIQNEIRNALEMPKVIAPHAKSVKVAYSVKAGDEERVGKTIGKFSSKDAPYGTTTKRDFSPMSPSFTPVS